VIVIGGVCAASTGHSAEVSEPQILSAFAGKEIKHIAAGGAYEDDTNGGFSLVVSSAGHLYTFGSNMHGQLGAYTRKVSSLAQVKGLCLTRAYFHLGRCREALFPDCESQNAHAMEYNHSKVVHPSSDG
jgi:hypothetical protein